MKLGHWVVLGSVIAFIVTVYVTMFRSVPVITTQLVSTARMFTATAPQNVGFDPNTLKEVQQIDPFKTKTLKVEFSEFSCASPLPQSTPFKLLSTAVLSDRSKSLAVLSVPGRGAFEVREGQSLSETLQVHQINRMQVLLKNMTNNSCEVIGLVVP